MVGYSNQGLQQQQQEQLDPATASRVQTAAPPETAKGFQYDPNSGYYYDVASGFYYDAVRQLYYHSVTQKWFTWYES